VRRIGDIKSHTGHHQPIEEALQHGRKAEAPRWELHYQDFRA
jgi:hypothetical protein